MIRGLAFALLTAFILVCIRELWLYGPGSPGPMIILVVGGVASGRKSYSAFKRG